MLKIKDINKLMLINSYVLIKPDRQVNDKIIFPSGQELFISTEYQKEKHISVVGEVIKIPIEDKLVGKKYLKKMDWETHVEVKKGDKVWFNWDTLNISMKYDSRCFYYRNEFYLFVPYNQLFVAKRNNEVICLNGYCLLQPIEEKRKSVLDTPVKEKKNWMKVVYTGNPYIRHREGYVQAEDIKAGDTVITDEACDILLEYPMHAQFRGNEIFYRVQRHLIMAKLEND